MSGDYQTAERMRLKLEAIPLPDLHGMSVLDVGCDHGFWSFLAADRGARRVVGLDRNRKIQGEWVDLIKRNQTLANHQCSADVRFYETDIGKSWRTFGSFDVVFMFSLYHHIFNNVGEHEPIWFWLWQQMNKGSVLLWENPMNISDPVARNHITSNLHHLYHSSAILEAAKHYFYGEMIGPALHSPTREVWQFTPKRIERNVIPCVVREGSGGATRAFTFADCRRIREIENGLGLHAYPGSLNLHAFEPKLDWDKNYYPIQLMDVINRKLGFNSDWGPRTCRLYPLTMQTHMGESSVPVYAMRFHKDTYPRGLIEVIAEGKLRHLLTNNFTEVTGWV